MSLITQFDDVLAVKLGKRFVPPEIIDPSIDPVLPVGMVALDAPATTEVSGDPRPPCGGCDSIPLGDPVNRPLIVSPRARPSGLAGVEDRAGGFLDMVLAWVSENPGITLALLVLLAFLSSRR